MKRALGIIWVLPLAIPAWLVIVLPLRALGYLEFKHWEQRGIALFRAIRPFGGQWWIGFALPCCAIYRDNLSWYWEPAMIRHEVRHCQQMFWLGPLFLLAYPGASLVAAMQGRHFYRDNWFERDARRFSGEDRLAV